MPTCRQSWYAHHVAYYFGVNTAMPVDEGWRISWLIYMDINVFTIFPQSLPAETTPSDYYHVIYTGADCDSISVLADRTT
jgi:hypothetical protein